MALYKRILCPVDGSDTGTKGLKEAIKLAKDQDAKLRLVHIVNEFIFLPSYEDGICMNELVAMMREDGAEVLAKALKLAREAGVEPEPRLIESLGGAAAQIIIEEAKMWVPDIIVMGTHGRRGIRRLVLGSDAEEVVRTVPIPVLLVRGTGSA